MPRPVTFVHAADLHLGAAFTGLDVTVPGAEQVRQALVDSTFAALERVVSTCLRERADFLVVAGDVYNAADRSLRAQLRFHAALERLDEAGVRVFVVHGNHDPLSGWSAGLELPATCVVFPADRVERVEVERDGVTVCAVYGRSFATAAETANLAAGFRREPGDPLAVGLLHCNVGGQQGHEPYAPATVDDLRRSGMDYWALGHVHAPMILADEPWVVYAGCSQGLNPRETGARGCWLVTADAGGVGAPRFIETEGVLWFERALDISTVDGAGGLRRLVREACDAVRTEAGERPAVLRVDLTGRGPAHALLARPGALAELTADIRDEQLAGEPWVWLDRIRDRGGPALDLTRLSEQQDFAGDLVRLALEVGGSHEADALVAEVLRPVLECTGALDALDLDADDVVARARDLLLDRLGEVS